MSDQKAVLGRVMEGFGTVLGATDGFVSEDGWKNRGSWGKREWEIWETWGWYRHFCREVRFFFFGREFEFLAWPG